MCVCGQKESSKIENKETFIFDIKILTQNGPKNVQNGPKLSNSPALGGWASLSATAIMSNFKCKTSSTVLEHV